MKIRTRELALLAGGLVMGAVIALSLTTTTSQPVHNPPLERVSEVDSTAQSSFQTVLAAIAADDYDQFVSVAGDTFRSHITPTTFHALSQSLAPRMQRGCTPTYLGQLRQNGAEISLWILAFADGGDDRLARMSMSQDRVDGFLITQAF
jgi:hypothetical protein